MSRFTSNKLQTIELKRIEIVEGEEKEIIEYVKIPLVLSYEQVMRMTKKEDTMEMSKDMLLECIKEWTIKDEDGTIPEITEANIMRLDVETITAISIEIQKLLVNNQDKKK